MSEWRETEIGKVPKHWEICNVNEIKSPDKKSIISGPFGSNISAKYFVEFGVPVIRGNNLSLTLTEKFKDNGFVFITEEKADELNTWAKFNDIVFTAVGTIGQVGIILENQRFKRYIISNKQLRLTVNENKVLPLFSYYWFASPLMVDIIKQRNTGSSVPLINLSVLKSLNIPVPPLPEQKAIAEVLSSLDDKIDLLHRQNKTLEQMAETLFRQWFVEEAGEDWEWHQLDEFVVVHRGLSYKGAGLTGAENGTPMHNLNSVFEGGGYKESGIKYYNGEFKERHKVFPGDVIVTNTEQGHEHLLIGYPAIVPANFGNIGIFSQHIYRLEIKSKLSNFFLYHLLKTHDIHEQIAGATNGSTVNMLSKDGIEWARFRMPQQTLIDDFTQIVNDHYKKQELNQALIRTLESLRNTLLPKLMSAEVRIASNG